MVGGGRLAVPETARTRQNTQHRCDPTVITGDRTNKNEISPPILILYWNCAFGQKVNAFSFCMLFSTEDHLCDSSVSSKIDG